MPLIVHDPRSDVIMRLLQLQSHGVTLRQIQDEFHPPLGERAAQRLLASLVAVGALTTTGANRYRRYHLRTRSGRLGTVTWVDPRSEVGLAVAGLAPVRASPKANGASASAPPPKVAVVVPATTSAPPPPNGPSHIAPVGNSLVSGAPILSAIAGAVATPVSTNIPAARVPLPSTKTIPASRVQPLLDRLVPNLVRRHITPDHVLLEARMPAVTSFALRPGESPDDLATLLTAELDRLAPEDLVRYGLTRAEFDAWREIEWPAGSALRPPAAMTPLPPLPLPPSITATRVLALLAPVAEVVRRNLTPGQLPTFIEQTARLTLRDAETSADWQTLLAAELSRFRIEDCAAYQIRPERYRAWRKSAWPAKA